MDAQRYHSTTAIRNPPDIPLGRPVISMRAPLPRLRRNGRSDRSHRRKMGISRVPHPAIWKYDLSGRSNHLRGPVRFWPSPNPGRFRTRTAQGSKIGIIRGACLLDSDRTKRRLPPGSARGATHVVDGTASTPGFEDISFSNISCNIDVFRISGRWNRYLPHRRAPRGQRVHEWLPRHSGTRSIWDMGSRRSPGRGRISPPANPRGRDRLYRVSSFRSSGATSIGPHLSRNLAKPGYESGACSAVYRDVSRADGPGVDPAPQRGSGAERTLPRLRVGPDRRRGGAVRDGYRW